MRNASGRMTFGTMVSCLPSAPAGPASRRNIGGCHGRGPGAASKPLLVRCVRPAKAPMLVRGRCRNDQGESGGVAGLARGRVRWTWRPLVCCRRTSDTRLHLCRGVPVAGKVAMRRIATRHRTMGHRQDPGTTTSPSSREGTSDTGRRAYASSTPGEPSLQRADPPSHATGTQGTPDRRNLAAHIAPQRRRGNGRR